ncbi:MAG: ribbon-helix-helix protein, CopG family [Verrucomicrobiota bacterium]
MKAKTHERAKGQTALTFSLPEELKARIESEAKKARRSKSSWLVVTIEDILNNLDKKK